MALCNIKKGLIDLNQLGKFKSIDGVIYFSPPDTQKHSSNNQSGTGSGSKYTVKGLMDMNRSMPK